MTTTETDRIELHAELTEAVGPVATKLMKHLPPDWTQLATKTDLETGLSNLGAELRGEMKAMEGRINSQIAKFTLPIVLTMLGLTVTLIVSGALNGAA